MNDSGAEGISYPPQGSETATAFIPAAPLDLWTMKFLAIILALAIFAGSPASVFSEEPASQLHLLKQNLHDYFKNVSRHFEHQGDLLQQSDVVKAVREQAFESLTNISRRFQKLGQEMPSEVIETVDLAIGIPTGVAEKLYRAIHNFSRRLEPATKELYKALEPVVNSRAEQTLEKVRPYAAVFRDRIHEIGQGQTERLKSRLQELETLGPQIQSVLGQIQEVQVALQPLADELQDIIRQKVQGAASVARPYVRPVLDATKEYTAKFKNWAINPFFTTEQ